MSAKNNSNQFDIIINEAGKKLGISPDALRAAINDPNKAQSMLNEIDKKTGGKFNASNPESMKNMIKNNPQTQKMYDDLMRGGKNG